MLTNTEKIKLIALGAKYKVNILSHVPGYVILTIGTWNTHKDKFISVISQLKNHTYVKDITCDNAVIEIYYDQNLLENQTEIKEITKLLSSHI